MEFVFTWIDFFKFSIVLIVLFWLLKFMSIIGLRLLKRIHLKRQLKKVSQRVLLIYIPLSVILLFIAFISINYLVHGILLLVLGIIFFHHIKSYFSGILFKINPLTEEGIQLKIGNFRGSIEQLLPFGIILKEHESKRFINYSFIERHGFSIDQRAGDFLHRTLYILDDESESNVLDLMFDNPMINLTNKPSLQAIPNKEYKMLNFTLERGAKLNDFISFLQQYSITVKHQLN